MRIVQDRKKRMLILSCFVILISAFNFMSIEGSENVRAVQIVTLIVCGMGVGVALMSVLTLIRANRENKAE